MDEGELVDVRELVADRVTAADGVVDADAHRVWLAEMVSVADAVDDAGEVRLAVAHSVRLAVAVVEPVDEATPDSDVKVVDVPVGDGGAVTAAVAEPVAVAVAECVAEAVAEPVDEAVAVAGAEPNITRRRVAEAVARLELDGLLHDAGDNRLATASASATRAKSFMRSDSTGQL